MNKYRPVSTLLSIFIFCVSCQGQVKTNLPKDNVQSETSNVTTSYGPNHITRNINQDSKGNIWIAAFDGVFRYDGTSFTNVTSKISSSRFFSLLEDSNGNLWFGSIGSGVYRYDGKSFQNLTTKEGLVSNEIVSIYEDETGNIWFGGNYGVSRYNGKSFRNYKIKGDSIFEDKMDQPWLNFATKEKLHDGVHEINSIVEDQTGKFWLGTRGNTFVYDGETFTTITHNGKPFINVRRIIKDRQGDIWLGGYDGLWRYDGNTFTNITKNFVGYIYEDRNGNIWTSSQNTEDRRWALSRYDQKSLSDEQPSVTEIKSEYEDNKGMMFGILEANDGSIWFGTLNGVSRYDGNNITNFKDKWESND